METGCPVRCSDLPGALLASAIVLYNVWHKDNACSPLLMGACRALLCLCLTPVARGSTRSTPGLILATDGRTGSCDVLAFTPDGTRLLAAPQPELAAEWEPRFLSLDYDERSLPAQAVGMFPGSMDQARQSGVGAAGPIHVSSRAA